MCPATFFSCLLCVPTVSPVFHLKSLSQTFDDFKVWLNAFLSLDPKRRINLFYGVQHTTSLLTSSVSFDSSRHCLRWSKGTVCENRIGVWTRASETDRGAPSTEYVWLRWTSIARRSGKKKNFYVRYKSFLMIGWLTMLQQKLLSILHFLKQKIMENPTAT